MWHLLVNLLRRARLRGLREGRVQRVRVEVFDHNTPDDAERWQDYGYAANADAGEGLVIHAGGHVVVLRMDRTASRPQLAKYEVCVWHEEGHKLTLKSGRIIEADCDTLRVIGKIEATETITAPHVVGTVDVSFGGVSGINHRHGAVQNGLGVSDPPTG